MHVMRYKSPFGTLVLTADDEGLTGLWFEGSKHIPKTVREAEQNSTSPFFLEATKWLDIYFSGKVPDFTPTLHATGSPFRQRVWDVLMKIPYGETITYGDIAALIAKERGVSRMSAQAVGGAVGHNPISIIVPCHRVIGAHGNLTGYGNGVEKKVMLLKLEHVDTSQMSLPK